MKPYERFTKIKTDTGREYIFDKYIFLSAIIFLLLLFFAATWLNGGLSADKHFYIRCNDADSIMFLNGSVGGGCKNPLYHDYKYSQFLPENFTELEWIPNGFTYGEPPPKFLGYFEIATIITLLLAFGINHIKNNRGQK